MSRYPAIEELLPHRAPMILLDEVVDHDARSIVCRAKVPGTSPFVRDGQMPAVVALEHMAQATAALLGLHALAKGGPIRGGYLVGSRQLDLEIDELAVGDRLEVRAEHVWGEEQFATFACSLHRDGVRVASATLNVLRTGADE